MTYSIIDNRILYKDLSSFESVLKQKIADKAITFFLRKFGTDILIIRSKSHQDMTEENPDSTSESLSEAALSVYGQYSGLSPQVANSGDMDHTDVTVTFPARIIIGTIPTSPFDAAVSGVLEKQIIYTLFDVLPNDRFFLTMAEKSKKEFLVGQHLVTGQTIEIIKRFEVNNIAGD